LAVGGEQRDALDKALRDEQTVERVAMQQGRFGNGDRMLAGHREFVVAAAEQIATKEVWLPK
jgi:hypothetical protein